MKLFAIVIIGFFALLVLGGLVIAFCCIPKGKRIGAFIAIALVASLFLVANLVFGGQVSKEPQAVTQMEYGTVYVQWDPVSEEYLKWRLQPDSQYIRYIQNGGETLCHYKTDGKDILINHTRLEYDAIENCYWQRYEKDGQIYKSKIFAVEDEAWDDNYLFYQYRTDNGTACVGFSAPSGDYAMELNQANTAIAQKDYESAYLILSAIAEHSPEAKKLLSKFAFVPLNITSVYGGYSNTQTYTYTSSGYLATHLRTDPAYDYATYTHDDEGRLLTEHLEYDDVEYGDRRTKDVYYTYDSSGNLVTKASGNVGTNYTYDSNGNLIHEITVNSGGYTTETAYTYDSNHNLIAKTNTSGGGEVYTDTYTYDERGNLISHTERSPYWTNQYTYTYDQNGNLLSEHNDDGSIILNTYYYYDQDSRLVKKEAEFSIYRNGVQSINTRTCTYTYDENGQLVKQTDTVDSNVRTLTYSYDRFGNMTSYVDSSSYLTHDITVSYSYQLFYYPQGVPEHIQEILVRQPPL